MKNTAKQESTTRCENCQLLKEKDLNLLKDEENANRCRGKLENVSMDMIQTIQLFYQKTDILQN